MKKFLIILIFAWFAGCYTVIKHPSISYTDSSGGVYTSHVYYRSNCVDCHSSSELSYFYSFIPAHNLSPWAYYNIPWWFQWSNNLTDTGQATTNASSAEGVRNFGVHRNSNVEGGAFSAPPPTRSPSNSGGNIGSSSSSSMEKGKNSRDGGGVDSVRGKASEDGSKAQDKEENKNRRRNIGSRRK